MTFSLSDVHERWMNLVKDSARDKDDLTLSVVRTLGAFLSPDSPPTPRDAVSLLWEYDQDSPLHESTSRLSAQAKRGLLDCLDWMYEKYRVPYEPDQIDSENLIDLAIELHVAAARAFRIKQANHGQQSEELVSSLKAVERTMERIKIALKSIEGQSYFGNPAIAVSTDAIWAIVQVELSYVSRSHGNYADAIHYLDLASSSYISAIDNCLDDPLSDDGSAWRREDNVWVKALKSANVAVGDESNAWKETINRQLTPLDMPLAEAASLFTSLKHSPPDDLKWNQITQDCAGLAYLPQLEWEVFSGVVNQDTIQDDEGFDVTWSEFWRHAEAWASAQLSPSQLIQMHRKQEKDAAKRRLRNYFFSSSWPSLPKRAQEALVQADKVWNDEEEGRIEAIFNELRIATEEMCNHYIWRPLENLKSSEWFPEMDDFEQRRQEKDDNSYDPNLIGLIWPCEQQFYEKFLAQRKLRSLEIQFLTCDLPKISKKLWYTRRNLAEHKLDKMAQHDAVEEFFKMFLGIGQRGILPELARIGRKLQSPGK